MSEPTQAAVDRQWEAELTGRLQELVGLPPEPGAVAAEPVNTAMIRHWCEALGDTNPVYLDDAAARSAGHAGQVAPPTMLQAWTMRGLGAASQAPTTAARVLAILDEAGFTSVVATNCVQTYERYLHPGDRLREMVFVESISAQKQTSLGTGYFVTTRRNFLDQDDQVVAVMQFRLLKFRPRPAIAVPPPAPAPVVTRDTAFFFEGLARGEVLAQRCAGCAQLRHPPAPLCPDCGEGSAVIERLSGAGTVYSYVVVHHPQPPGFSYPLIVALVQLDEGIRMVGAVEDIEPGEVAIGLPVELGPAVDADRLPSFRPRGNA